VYVEPDEDNVESPQEECFLYYLDEDEAGSNDISERQQENEGPPQLSVTKLLNWIEELERLSNMGVISEYPFGWQ